MPTWKVNYLAAVRDAVFPESIVDRPKIVAVIPAHNEEEDIPTVLRSLARQRMPLGLDLHVYIALDNCTDRTEEVIRKTNEELNLPVFLLETKGNKERKVGALNQIYHLFYGDRTHVRQKEVGPLQKRYADSIQAFLGLDADVQLEEDCVKILWEELQETSYTGCVSANYTCLFPEGGASGKKKWGTLRKEWWISQQIRDFTDWTLRQKQNGHTAEIAGGQCTLFRPEALLQVREAYKLNGFHDNKTDTEDLLLTQYLRACGWNCRISREARCYVDSMDTRKTYFAQRKKWVSGTTDYMLMDGLKTSYSRSLWLQELGLFTNFFIRVILVVLISLSFWLKEFQWNWFWALPFLFSAILNTTLTFLSPDYRPADVILCALGINPEIYLWLSIRIHLQVWASKLRVTKEDGWENQYRAERGESMGNRTWLPILLVFALVGVFYVFREQWFLKEEMQYLAKSLISMGYPILSLLTIVMTLIVVRKIFLLRYPYRP